MAYVLDFDKQCMAIAALAEGTSIRAVERMTGVHRDTIMRLGMRVGEACADMMDKAMYDLPCQDIQVDELWGFTGKKQRRVANEPKTEHYQGGVWTYVAIDRETKLIPSFVCGKRDMAHTQLFLDDLGSRVGGRIQLSSDALQYYRIATETAFVLGVDHGAIVKTYTTPADPQTQRRYSPARMVRVSRVAWEGNPDPKKICTSHIEAQNLTIRMHVRRLTRLTNAFSKRIENFRAAMALHFAYVNFVKIHTALKTTPAIGRWRFFPLVDGPRLGWAPVSHMDYLRELATAIRQVHGCEPTHVETVRVTEMFRGQIAWDGAVEVFDVIGHPKAKRCYAWGVPNEANPKRLDIITVLEIPPVDSPQSAVQAAIIHASKN